MKWHPGSIYLICYQYLNDKFKQMNTIRDTTHLIHIQYFKIPISQELLLIDDTKNIGIITCKKYKVLSHKNSILQTIHTVTVTSRNIFNKIEKIHANELSNSSDTAVYATEECKWVPLS